MTKEMTLPLKGLRVVELGTHFAVPSVGRMLADWGAEVIKVEDLKGDAWRFVGRNQRCPITDEENPFFAVPNANKKFVALNLKSPEGKEALLKLIDGAEIFLSNMRMKALVKLGFDYETLAARCPGLIYAHFTGYGYQGPDAEKPGFDSVAFWARSGAMLDWGTQGSFPFLAPTGAGDAMTGSILCAGVLAALLAKRESGKGTFVSSSLMGSSIWYNNAAVVSTQYGNPFPKDKDHPANPFGWQYECADGQWLMIGVVDYSDAYRKIFHLFGRDDLVEDERFNTISAVQQHLDEFMPILRGHFKEKPRDEWVRLGGSLVIMGCRQNATTITTGRERAAMFFRDDSCISENTIERYYNDYRIHELMGSDWFGIMSLSRSGHVVIDNRYDVSGVGDAPALNFVSTHASQLQEQDYPYRMFDCDGAHYLVFPIRVNEHGYLIFFLYCRLSSPFEEKDMQWYYLFSEVSYKRLLLNNELIQQRNYMARVMESTQDMVTVLDREYNVLSSNQAADELLDAEDSNDKFSNLDAGAKVRLLTLVDEAIATNSKRYLNNAVAEYDGIKHILDLTISPLSNSKGVPGGVVVVGSDITKKQMMEYEFEQLKHYAMLGEISLGLSHDVKNPLMNIRSCVTLLKRNSALLESGNELLDTIVGEVRRIDDTIGQMLSFGKVGKQNSYTFVNINEVLENCIQVVQRQKACRQLTLRYLPGKPIPLIKAKNSDMQQIFLNVMLNALQAIDDKGNIDVTSFYDTEQNRIHVTITDNGCGIKEEDLAKLFNPYYSTKPNGTGLGLFMVKRIAEQYRGTVRLESRKWQDTVCTITLPCE